MSLLIYLLIFVQTLPTTYCKRSFTIVLDTTNSMIEDLDIIKTGIRVVMNDLDNRTDFEDYIIVPFNYPDVGTPSIAHSPKELVDDLNVIKAKDGVECPENSVAGIKKALEISEPGSTIYVFTDAYARDYGNISEITNLCINKFTQVQIFLSGVCFPTASNRSPVGNIDIYYEIVGTCSGAILRLDSAHNLRQAFPYIKELNRIDWNDIATYDSFNQRKELTFRIDTFTTDFMVVVSGDRPQVQILNHQGQAPRTVKIIDTKSTQVFRLLTLDVGEYTVYIRCQGTTSATLYRRHVLPYEYGFSTKEPRNLLETSRKLMPGITNYILICSLDTTFRPGTIEFTDGEIKTELNLEETGKPGSYISKVFVDNEKTYRISIIGYNTVNSQQVSATTKLLVPQKLESSTTWTQPISKIIKEEIDVVEYGDNLTIVCKVHGYPKPKIQWKEDNGHSLHSEEILLEIPSIYLSYVTIENVTANSKIHCKCENSIGAATDSADIVVKRTFFFEVKRKPENTSIEYGSEGKLYCAVNAYPDAVTKWLHNNTELKISDNIVFNSEDNFLLIKNMTLEDGGVYTCEIKNSEKTESYNAFVTVTGLEMPEVEVTEKEVIRKPGEGIEIECRVIKGLPIPTVAWTYKSKADFYFGDLPEGALVENGKLKITSIETVHKGVYRCDAANVMGQHFSEVNLKVQYSPIIEKDDVSKLTVRDGENVVMTCRVRASPKAIVRWEMSQDDVICNLDARHRTDYLHTHSFTASWNDSGNYHCIAENSVGRAEKTITLNVLVAPYIEPTKTNTFTVAVGDTVQLPCNVLFGNPAPSMKWKFITPDTESSILKRDNSTNMLIIKKASKSNEGWYICIVENEIGLDTIKYYVKVQ